MQNKTTATDAVEVKDRSAGTSKFGRHSLLVSESQ